jgi:hypothetical protein
MTWLGWSRRADGLVLLRRTTMAVGEVLLLLILGISDCAILDVLHSE